MLSEVTFILWVWVGGLGVEFGAYLEGPKISNVVKAKCKVVGINELTKLKFLCHYELKFHVTPKFYLKRLKT